MPNGPAERVYNQSKLLFSEQQVNHAVDRLAVRLSARLANTEPVILCMMNGGVTFSAAVMQRLHMPLQFDYMHLSRYRDSCTGGQIEWRAKPQSDLQNRTVVLIDDICDQGASLLEAVRAVQSRDAGEVITAVLVRRQRPDACFEPDFAALECGSGFVLGWGMDFAGYGRNLSSIRLLDEPRTDMPCAPGSRSI